MNEMHDQLSRLEARIDHQAARIDALYEVLERQGILPGQAFENGSDERPEAPPARPRKRSPSRRRAPGFHLGNATGV